jgi:excisionase family DNA binding protein
MTEVKMQDNSLAPLPQLRIVEVDLSTTEARAELNCSAGKIWDLLNRGELSGYYVGSQMRITRPSIDEYKIRNKYIPRKDLKGKGSMMAARKKTRNRAEAHSRAHGGCND